MVKTLNNILENTINSVKITKMDNLELIGE